MAHHASRRVQVVQDRRRSNAAGPHDHQPTRGAVERAAIDAELCDDDQDADSTLVEPVDLDEVIDAELVEHRIEDSPLYGRTRLCGRIVTDPREIEEIRACIAFGKLPFWQRWFSPKPAGWGR